MVVIGVGSLVDGIRSPSGCGADLEAG